MATSEFARDFAQKHKETTETVGSMRLMSELDDSLREVREVFDELLRNERSDGNHSAIHLSFMASRRMRAVMSRLQPKE